MDSYPTKKADGYEKCRRTLTQCDVGVLISCFHPHLREEASLLRNPETGLYDLMRVANIIAQAEKAKIEYLNTGITISDFTVSEIEGSKVEIVYYVDPLSNETDGWS